MSFAGLQDLLRKKKAVAEAEVVSAAAPATAITTTTSTTSKATASTTEEPYAAAAARARAKVAIGAVAQQNGDALDPMGGQPRETSDSGFNDSKGRRRSRAQMGGDSEDVSETGPPQLQPRQQPKHSPSLLSRAECEAVRTDMVASLAACMAAAAEAFTTTASSTPGRDLCLPAALRRFLHARYIERDSEAIGSATRNAGEELAECAALRAARAELGSTAATRTTIITTTIAAAGTDGNTTTKHSESEQLAELINTTWYLTAAYWGGALTGATHVLPTVSRQSPELIDEFGEIAGWSYPVYLLAAHALPCELRMSCGREIAIALEAWRAARRTVTASLELLAYLVADHTHILTSERSANAKDGDGSQKVRDKAEKAESVVMVPPSIRDGLHAMLVKAVQRTADFLAARQAYADLTLGNANWKLGLFSAGEVHMRRSVEKLERNRIAHVLNNELAMRLLHATRELVQFAEQRWRTPGEGGQLIRAQFFRSVSSS